MQACMVQQEAGIMYHTSVYIHGAAAAARVRWWWWDLSGSPTPFPIAIDGDFFFIDRPSHFVGGMEETIGRTYWLASNKL